MYYFYRNECTLDTISFVEHYVEGVQLNWCAFLLQELFEAAKEIYKHVTHFIYRYIIFVAYSGLASTVTTSDLCGLLSPFPLDRASTSSQLAPWHRAHYHRWGS